MLSSLYTQPMATESNQNQNETFLKLLAQSEVVLHAYLRSLVNDQNHLSEVLENTFIVGWKKYDQFTGNEADFTKWLCVIGKYEALKYRQSLARDRLILSEELVQQIANERYLCQQVAFLVTRELFTASIDFLPCLPGDLL